MSKTQLESHHFQALYYSETSPACVHIPCEEFSLHTCAFPPQSILEYQAQSQFFSASSSL